MATETRKVHADLRKTLESKVATLFEQMENMSIFERDLANLLGAVRAAMEVSNRISDAERQLEEARRQAPPGPAAIAHRDRISALTRHRDRLLGELSKLNAGLKVG